MKTAEQKPIQKEYHDIYSATYDSVELWEIDGKPNRFRLDFISRRAALMAELAKSGASSVAAEIGCGTGIYTSHWARTSKVIYGIDISSAMLKKATAKSNSERAGFVQADAECLPLQSSCCDVVYSVNLIEHLADIPKALREMARISKNRARVVISLPNDNPVTRKLINIYYRILRYLPGRNAFQLEPPGIHGISHDVPSSAKLIGLLNKTGIKVEGKYFMGFIERRFTRVTWAHGSMELLEKLLEKIPIVKSWAGVIIISGLVSKNE
jgi:ubiquinone/menaquinone biosynthesis C-methylase UbiE